MALMVSGMACPAPVACCAFAHCFEFEDEDGDGKSDEKETRSSLSFRHVGPCLRTTARPATYPSIAAKRLAAGPAVRAPFRRQLPMPSSALPLRC